MDTSHPESRAVSTGEAGSKEGQVTSCCLGGGGEWHLLTVSIDNVIL